MENTSKTSFFGKTSTRIGLGLLLLLLIVLFLLKYCRKDDPGSITFSAPIKAPVAIALIDANRFLNTQVAKAKITLIDPDTMVVTSNGLSFSTLELTGGVMSLALKQNAVFSDTAP
ncbi:MAG: hypothetical protein Q8K92_26190, partial [Leadbetterella sp.]|nr:hypothetical protein [Leadbetterella sp.]